MWFNNTCNDNTFVASHFSNNQIILSKARTVSIEEVFPCIYDSKSQCSAKSTCLTASNIMRINRSDPDLSSGIFVFVKSFKLPLQQDI